MWRVVIYGYSRYIYVRLAGDHLYEKLLFTWLSPVMSMMMSFCAVLFFLRDVLAEILNEIESVSVVGFPTYSSIKNGQTYFFSAMLTGKKTIQLRHISTQ